MSAAAPSILTVMEILSQLSSHVEQSVEEQVQKRLTPSFSSIHTPFAIQRTWSRVSFIQVSPSEPAFAYDGVSKSRSIALIAPYVLSLFSFVLECSALTGGTSFASLSLFAEIIDSGYGAINFYKSSSRFYTVYKIFIIISITIINHINYTDNAIKRLTMFLYNGKLVDSHTSSVGF